MIDFLRSGDDIAFDGVRFAEVPDKATQVKQRLALRFRRFYGEWFLDISKGIAYRETVKVKNPNIEVINSLLKSEALKGSGITEIIQWDTDIDIARRVFTVLDTTRLKLDTGEIIEFGVNL